MVWRTVLLATVFVGVGWLTSRAVIARSPVRSGAYDPQIRLAGEMAGLFAGGGAALLVGIGMVVLHGRRR